MNEELFVLIFGEGIALGRRKDMVSSVRLQMVLMKESYEKLENQKLDFLSTLYND